MRCERCGGDDTTHLAVAGSLAKVADVPITALLEVPCTILNRLHKTIMEAERRVLAGTGPAPIVDARSPQARTHGL